MFELRVEVEFSAAHHLDGYPGDCQRPHGHNFVVEVFARAVGLDSIGLAMDFKKLKRATQELVAQWDHQDLNELQDFKTINPSAEQIAKLSFERLAAMMGDGSGSKPGVWIDRVTIWENPRCSATYFGPAREQR